MTDMIRGENMDTGDVEDKSGRKKKVDWSFES